MADNTLWPIIDTVPYIIIYIYSNYTNVIECVESYVDILYTTQLGLE